MAKARDKVWFVDDKGKKWPALVVKGQTLVDGLPAPDSYDAETVDLAFYNSNEDDGGTVHQQIAGGATAVKQAKTAKDQTTPNHWWPR